MSEQPAERSSHEVRKNLADVLNDAIRGRTTYVTNRGRRVAAIVPVSVAEQAETPGESSPTA